MLNQMIQNEVFTQYVSHPGTHKRIGLNITKEFNAKHKKTGQDRNAGAASRNTHLLTSKQTTFHFIKC